MWRIYDGMHNEVLKRTLLTAGIMFCTIILVFPKNSRRANTGNTPGNGTNVLGQFTAHVLPTDNANSVRI